jgi:hypothetical protein
MVKSRLDPENVSYKETKELDDNDIGHASSVYEYRLYDRDIEIVLGKQNTTFSKYNIVYYPVYLVVNDKLQSRIGVLEGNINTVLEWMEEDGDITIPPENMIVYASKDYITNVLREPISTSEKIIVLPEIEDSSTVEEDRKETGEDFFEASDDITSLRIPEEKISKTNQTTSKKLEDGIFKTNPNTKVPDTLPEEKKEDADAWKQDYQESAQLPWIQKFMKNNNYEILDNEGGGDCFFAVLRDAFHQIGKDTTVDKMRALLSKEITDKMFSEYRTLYTNFLSEYQDKEKEIRDIKKTIAILKKRITEKAQHKVEQKMILDEATKLVDQHKKLVLEKADAKELLDEFIYMKDVDTLEKFREFILTSKYWADDASISILEKLLNIKIIIFSEEAFENGDLDSVLKCGQVSEHDMERQGNYQPDYYILACYTGNHYKLITYKKKHIFKFREVPYDVKALVINKCLERNSGPYYFIQDFMNLKTRLGLDAHEGESYSAEDDDYLSKDLYEKDIVFSFHATSNGKAKAGKGSGEKIPDARMIEFPQLNKIKDWRRKLDDSWIAPITIDGHRWNSVEHYYLGSQYKKGFPDFYLKFSSDSGSEISKDLAVAKAAVSKSGKWKDRVLREKHIRPDPDFYDVGKNSRSRFERETALRAKFTQNLDLKQVLFETKMAKLVHFVRGSEPEVDETLMKLRFEFRNS